MNANPVRRLGRQALDATARFGRAHLFLAHLLGSVPAALARPALVVQQMRFIGVHTLVIVALAALFVGMVMALQVYHALVDTGTETALGVLVALALVRELGPVVTALLFAGRAGSAVAAEIGLMKSTEQLAGMAMMAVDPVRRVLAPRFLAALLSMPLLAAIFSLVGIYGGWFAGVHLLGVDDGAYWSQMQARVDLYNDVGNGVIKSLVFGVVAGWIAVFQGYHAAPTAAGVSRATTQTVVATSLAVLGLDVVLTAIMFGD